MNESLTRETSRRGNDTDECGGFSPDLEKNASERFQGLISQHTCINRTCREHCIIGNGIDTKPFTFFVE